MRYCRFRTLEMLKILKLQDLSFGILTKLMAFRASGTVLRMLSARFVTLLSVDAVPLSAFAHILGRAVLGQKREKFWGLCANA